MGPTAAPETSSANLHTVQKPQNQKSVERTYSTLPLMGGWMDGWMNGRQRWNNSWQGRTDICPTVTFSSWLLREQTVFRGEKQATATTTDSILAWQSPAAKQTTLNKPSDQVAGDASLDRFKSNGSKTLCKPETLLPLGNFTRNVSISMKSEVIAAVEVMIGSSCMWRRVSW